MELKHDPKFGISIGYDRLLKNLKTADRNEWVINFKSGPFTFKIPPILNPRLAEQIRNQAKIRKGKRTDLKPKYLLNGGLFRCQKCGKTFYGTIHGGVRQYEHYTFRDKYSTAKFCCRIKAKPFENAILETIFQYFFDKPKFDKAIEQNLKPTEKRKELERKYGDDKEKL